MASTVWRGFIAFGLVSVPVRLFRAARAERVSLRRLYRADRPASSQSQMLDGEEEPAPPAPVKGRKKSEASAAMPSPISAFTGPAAPGHAPEPALAPLRQVSVRGETNDVVSTKEVVKGYEYEKNRYVALDPEELKSLESKTATEMQIEEFVSLSEVDPVYFETSYYVAPDRGGEKAYALLFEALRTSNLVAVSQLAMHGREHIVVLRPGKHGLLAHTMFFSSEVRADEEYHAMTDLVKDKELALAQTLIQSLAAPFEPEKYRDTRRERLEELIAKKVAGQPITRAEEPKRQAAVVDITEALQKSLAALKKPASSEKAKPSGKLARSAGQKK
ncbi:MAG TPA: Ku protein [Chthoniobacterales bacterium]|nr:Ku protein [Chthoniobacterales bacterium]